MATPRLFNVQRIAVIAIDADGCLYNLYYQKLLMHLFIECEKSKNLSQISALLENLQPENIWNLRYQQLREAIFEILLPKIIASLRLVYPHDDIKFQQKLNDSKTKDLNVFAAVNKFIHIINKKDKNLLPIILQKTNSIFFNFILRKIKPKNYNRSINMNFSSRQDFALDVNAAAQNGTASIFEDHFHVGQLLKDCLGEKHEISEFCMADIYGNLPSGTSMQMIRDHHAGLNLQNNHVRYIYDHTKASIVYAIAHSKAKEVLNDPQHPQIDVYLLDDKKEILHGNQANAKHGIFTFYTEHPYLLPRNVVLHLQEYKNVLGDEYKVRGTGSVDERYEDSIRLMAKMCLADRKKDDVSTPDIDIANKLNVKEFLRQRKWPTYPIQSSIDDEIVAYESLHDDSKRRKIR